MGQLGSVDSIFPWRNANGTCIGRERVAGVQQVYCFGAGFWGQVGVETMNTGVVPHRINFTEVLGDRLPGLAVSLGQSCAWGANGRVACWGDATHGRTGHGIVAADAAAPREVSVFSR